MVEVKEVKIEENEQWNIINQTGILKNEKIMKPTPPPVIYLFERIDYLFEASLLTIPLSMLQAGLDLTLHQQYGYEENFNLTYILKRHIPNAFVLFFVFYWTNRYKATKKFKLFFFLCSIFCGIQVINFTVRDRSFFGMKKAPG
ncbi:hypothetical protein HDU92_001894 [Lobulomyces angularis]|nr:hypothetical protein HDU92_001894 [Lobulomyces angularis]